MNILVIGSGGREHTLVWKIAQSKNVYKIFCAPGNAGISELAQCIDINATDINKLIGFAKDLGLNTDQFSSCLNSNKYVKQVADDLASGQKAGVSGTPTTFVNGRAIVGAQPYSAFKTLIDQELSKVK